MPDRLRFGIFIAPFHTALQNPTLALQRDLEFIATAAERTQHIRLGTGVGVIGTVEDAAALAAWTEKHQKERAEARAPASGSRPPVGRRVA